MDAQAQQGGILPAAAALPVGSLLEITYRNGNTVEGIIKDSQGATWTGPPSTTTRGPRCKAA